MRTQPRDRVVGVRIDRRSLGMIDLLVDAGIHDTRSAAAAWLIREGLDAHRDLFERITTTAAQIRDLKVRAQAVSRGLADEPSHGPAKP